MKKIKNFFKTNLKLFVAFLVGAIFFSGVGYVVAATIQSSSVSYTTNKNSSITNVKQAVDELYNRISDYSFYKYWNDNYNGTRYAYGLVPTTTYSSKKAYIDSSNYPIYARTKIVDGTLTNQEICLYYDSKDFCIDNLNYWPYGNTNGTLVYGVTNLYEFNIVVDLKSRFRDDASCDFNTVGSSFQVVDPNTGGFQYAYRFNSITCKIGNTYNINVANNSVSIYSSNKSCNLTGPNITAFCS